MTDMFDPVQCVQAGLAHHRAGRLEEAEREYRLVIKHFPSQQDAWQLLGALAHQTRRVDEAIACLTHALAVGPPAQAVLYNLANALVDGGHFDEADAAFAQAAALEPPLADIWLNWGALAEKQGNTGLARERYLRVTEIAPELAAGWSNLAGLAHRAGQWNEAYTLARRAIGANPRSAVAHRLLADALRDLAQPAEAETAYAAALEVDPGQYAAWHNLGELLQGQDRLAEAVAAYRQALVCAPQAYETMVNLGGALKELADYDAGAKVYQQAQRLAPERSAAYVNHGLWHQEQGQFAEAERAFDLALAKAPDDPEARLNRALLWIQQGKLAASWREYEWRWKSRDTGRRGRLLEQPLWQGEPLAGRKILVHGEQGVGDEIMFASCLGDLVSEGAHVTLTCDRRLAPLFARSFPTVDVRAVERGHESWSSWSAEQVDFQVPAGSLPRYLRTSWQDFPDRAGFLEADRDLVAAWRERLDALGGGMKMGLSWRGGKNAAERRRRSPLPCDWSDFGHQPGVVWIDVQYAAAGTTVDNAEMPVPLVRFERLDPREQLDELAALLVALDGVVCVGNATAHLSGALGVPTWVLLPRYWGWRWFLDRATCPWYRSVRIRRQSRDGDWQEVLGRVGSEIGHFVA